MWKEFKEFAMKGNILDLAIGVVIGGAFGKIVSSLVENVIMPIVGMFTGGIDLTESFMFGTGEAQVKLGVFIQSILDFLIIAFSIFMALRIINRINRKKKEEIAEEPSTPVLDSKEQLLKEIRDLLKKQQA